MDCVVLLSKTKKARAAVDLKTLALLVGLGIGVGGAIRSFERSATRDIAARLSGPQKQVRLQTASDGPFGLVSGRVARGTIFASHFETDGLPLFTQPELRQNGALKLLQLRLSDFRLSGLPALRLEADIPNCRYDFDLAKRKGIVRLSKSGEGTGFVEIEEAGLEAFILRKFSEIKRVKVHLSPDGVRVEGYGEFLIIQTNFEVSAKLAAAQPQSLWLQEANITFDGRRAEPAVAEALLRVLNPVVDLDKDLKLHGAIDMQRVIARPGLLRVEGVVRIPKQSP